MNWELCRVSGHHDFDIIIFDCDGVILDSNKLKSDAFYLASKKYGEENAKKLVQLNHSLGGVNRHKKFKIFFEEIMNMENYELEYEDICTEFSKLVRQSYNNCDFTQGFLDCIESLPKNIKKYVVSGGAQDELREVFDYKKISKFFDGIYGGPTDKIEIITKLNFSNNHKVLFIGDGLKDWETADHFGFDFIFMSRYSEFKNYKEVIPSQKLNEIFDLRDFK